MNGEAYWYWTEASDLAIKAIGQQSLYIGLAPLFSGKLGSNSLRGLERR